jgi:hypothetical protein
MHTRLSFNPLRLAVPPSRLFVEATDFTCYTVLLALSSKNIECATVKVFEDFQKFLSFAREAPCRRLHAKMSSMPSPKSAL